MDELTHTKSVLKKVASANASELPPNGKGLPPITTIARADSPTSINGAAESPTEPGTREADKVSGQLAAGSLDNMLSRLNQHVQDEKRDLEFDVMNEGSLTVVRVSDRITGEVIRQIPEKEVVDLARKLNAMEPLQLFNALV